MSVDEFDEQALERALQAPGTMAELAEEERYLAMFRSARTGAGTATAVGSGRRNVRRLGTGVTLAVALAVATGGVAAAYSSHLPDPVQRAVHSVLAPIGVPAPETPRPVARKPRAPQATAPAVVLPSPPTVTRSPSRKPTRRPVPPPSASPTELPTATPTEVPPTDPAGSPTGTPSSDPTPQPASVSISSGAGNSVAPGGTAVVSGQVLDADGAPLAGIPVTLQQRDGGGWRRVTTVSSDGDGSVAIAVGPLQRTTDVRFVAQEVRSATWRFVVQPTMTGSSRTTGATATLTATANGGQPDDQVLLLTRRDGQLVQEGSARLGSGGSVRFDVPTPVADQWYVVQLPATDAHGAAQVRVKVKGAPAG
ncbi:hypothetical protein [Nocardioides conyzicola]|uniref:Carboxypeptidase regulatory-like domain-containing protein n=1 Tax=Nocardioides conyzicola TaxID=1651781 RepID=A0ABP8WI75_9ACTN